MVLSPRVITVDPTGTIARIVRGTLHLLDRPVVLSDIATGADALEEVGRGCNLLITTWEIDTEMRGLELALRAKQRSPEVGVIILADADEPADLDEETITNSPFLYLTRPLDPHLFLRLLLAGMDGKDLREAASASSGAAAQIADLGPVPSMDANIARGIVDQLLRDLGAAAIYLASRSGEVLLEVGAGGYVNREQLTHALLPLVNTQMEMKSVVGGQLSALQFYDGDEHDIFVLSVGLHHFMCAVFPGDAGGRQLGAVSRYGRRAAEDLAAVLGANAWMIAPPPAQEEAPRPVTKKRSTQEQDVIQLEKATGFEKPAEAPAEPEPALQLEPIQNLDIDKLFGQKVDASSLDDLFDPEKLEEIAKQSGKRGAIDFEQATQLGILPSS